MTGTNPSDLITTVENSELLYRSIRAKEIIPKDGKTRISSMGFFDDGGKPSVDRAKLHNNDPSKTQFRPSDGVIGLVAERAKAIELTYETKHTTEKKQVVTTTRKYQIDVCHRPEPTNFAHAQVEVTPEFQTPSTPGRLFERLAKLASERLETHGWELAPAL